jgi:hypothetical protein
MGGGPGDVAMDNRFSFKIYPRPDTVHKKKVSLNYDLMRTRIMRYRNINEKGKKEVICTWLVYALTGCVIGFVASIMVWCEDQLTELKRDTTQNLIK